MSSIAERLRERIAREGPISFAEFMGSALYDPEDGYYSRGAAIGEGGDFLTSPHVSAAFAATFARLFAMDAERLSGPVDFVEVGAGGGRFLEDFANALQQIDPETHRRLRLTAVEPSPAARQALAARRVQPAPRIFSSAEEISAEGVTGWIFSNELYDALPVVRVAGSDQGLLEVRVDAQGDAFVWSPAPASEALRAAFESAGVILQPGQKGEFAPAAEPLHRCLARALTRGWIVTVDYGHPARILYHPFARPEGTLAVHTRGRRGGDPLLCPGEQDLTAHVNWDALIRAGEAEGLRADRLARQGIFLTESGIFDFAGSDSEKWRIYRLVDPAGMGEEISVLVQSKGVAVGPATL
ncbi:MAG: SAM-dependent methyltransferase [Acidobacteriota bacterium]